MNKETNNVSYKVIDLFAGIGGIRIAFEEFGCQTVFSSEWDKAAQKMYEANFNELPFGDINEISPKDIPDHDILLAGFPCQPFSKIDYMNKFEDMNITILENQKINYQFC